MAAGPAHAPGRAGREDPEGGRTIWEALRMPRAARRIVLGIVFGLVVRALGGGGVPLAEAAVPCEALVGKWKWFTGGVVSINPDGTVAHDPGNDGTWECTDAARGGVTVRWRLGGYVNRLAMSGDGRALASTDPSQSYVTAQRIGAPRTVEASPPAKPAEVPRRPEPPPPAKPSVITPPASTAPAEPGRPGPCSGNACTRVAVEALDRCVWLRSSADDVVQAEVRLAGETVKMTLEKPDLAKVAKEAPRTSATARQAAARTRLDELRRQGHNIPYDPKVEGPRDAPAPGPTVDRSRAWHGTKYDPVWMKERPVFHARIDRAGGCVTDPGQILSYRVTSASGGATEASERAIPCTGEACADVDASSEQVAACRFANRGGRAIVVGIVRPSNRDVSVTLPLAPNGTARLAFFAGCLKADDIGRIEARYK